MQISPQSLHFIAGENPRLLCNRIICSLLDNLFSIFSINHFEKISPYLSDSLDSLIISTISTLGYFPENLSGKYI